MSVAQKRIKSAKIELTATKRQIKNPQTKSLSSATTATETDITRRTVQAGRRR